MSQTVAQETESDSGRTFLLELAVLFLKLGATAIGGPAVHISMMEEEVVTRRRWLTRAEFLDFLGATHLIPGPNSTEMAIQVGRARAGWRGLLVAGVCFILPAALMVGVLAWAYVRFGSLPQVASGFVWSEAGRDRRHCPGALSDSEGRPLSRPGLGCWASPRWQPLRSVWTRCSH
jgi:chromate transporter